MVTARLALVILAASAALGSAIVTPARAQSVAPAPSPSVDDIANGIEAFYRGAKTFKAAFKQVYGYGAQGSSKTKDGTGIVFVEKPGKASWRYANNGNRIVSDGTRVRAYLQKEKQMYDSPVAESWFSAALAFVGSAGNLRQSFTLTRPPSAQHNFAGFILLAEPRQPTPAFAKMALYVDSATYQVRRVLMVDAQGNKHRIDFTQAELNVASPPGEFVFTPPQGTLIIRR